MTSKRLQRSDEDDATQQRGSDVVGMAPRDAFLSGKRGRTQQSARRAGPQQRIDRHRCGHSRCRAATLASGQRQTLLTGSRCPGPGRRPARRPAPPERPVRGVTARVRWQIGMARIEDLYPGPSDHWARTVSPGPSRASPRMSSPGPTLPDASGGKGGNWPSSVSSPASRRMSLSTPAAVTSAPAPGPVMTSGLALYRS